MILNAAPARPVSADLLAGTDLLVVNRGEAADLLGCPETGLDAKAAAATLAAQGPGAVIVTLGAEGLVLANAKGAGHYPAQRATVVSTHGAGDAFIGALAAEWARGADLADAAAFGQAAASLHVGTKVDQRSGAIEALVRQQIEQGFSFAEISHGGPGV